MGRLKPILVLLLAALLLIDAGDCLAGSAQQDQDMDCCRSMTCAPVSLSSTCCSVKDSGQTPRVVPQVRVSLAPPVLAIVERVAASKNWQAKPSSTDSFKAPIHSPPDLYTLHLSLLI
jgi:hypothetical protein